MAMKPPRPPPMRRLRKVENAKNRPSGSTHDSTSRYQVESATPSTLTPLAVRSVRRSLSSTRTTSNSRILGLGAWPSFHCPRMALAETPTRSILPAATAALKSL
jgi:hypothetical protein